MLTGNTRNSSSQGQEKKPQHPLTQLTQATELQNPKNIGHSCFRMVAAGAAGMHIVPAAAFSVAATAARAGVPCQPPQPGQHCIPQQLPSPRPRTHPGTMLRPHRGRAKMMQPVPRSSSSPQAFIYSLPCILCLQTFLLAGGTPREGCSSPCGSLLFCLFVSHTELFV